MDLYECWGIEKIEMVQKLVERFQKSSVQQGLKASEFILNGPKAVVGMLVEVY